MGSLPPLQAIGRVDDLALGVEGHPGALSSPLERRVRLLRQLAQTHVLGVPPEQIGVGVGGGAGSHGRRGCRDTVLLPPLVVIVPHVGYGHIVAGVWLRLLVLLQMPVLSRVRLRLVFSAWQNTAKLTQHAAKWTDLRLLLRGTGCNRNLVLHSSES